MMNEYKSELREEVKSIIIDELANYNDDELESLDEYELVYFIFERYNSDGSYHYNTLASRNFVNKYMDEIYDFITDENILKEAFVNPEAFVVILLMTIAGEIVSGFTYDDTDKLTYKQQLLEHMEN